MQYPNIIHTLFSLITTAHLSTLERTLFGKSFALRSHDNSERVSKQSSPQISVASRLLSSVPKSHPHTLKTSRASCVQDWEGERRVERAQGVSWAATYLHPNIKPLRLVPIILDKRQDSMMYCRGACFLATRPEWFVANSLRINAIEEGSYNNITLYTFYASRGKMKKIFNFY